MGHLDSFCLLKWDSMKHIAPRMKNSCPKCLICKWSSLHIAIPVFRKYKRKKNKLRDTLIYQIYPESRTFYRTIELVSSTSQWAQKTNDLKNTQKTQQSHAVCRPLVWTEQHWGEMGVSEHRLGTIYDIKKSLLIVLGLIIVLLYYDYICGHVRKKVLRIWI